MTMATNSGRMQASRPNISGPLIEPGGCSGQCCSVFTFPSSPIQLRERWEMDGGGPDDLMIADMLIPLSPIEAAERAERFGASTPECGWDAIPFYTCRHWDEDTRLCTVYDHRPMMCETYPYGRECEHCEGCTEVGRECPRRPIKGEDGA